MFLQKHKTYYFHKEKKMADDLQLVNIVAFDTEGRAVIQPLKQWKLSYRERQASIEVQCGAYRRNYTCAPRWSP